MAALTSCDKKLEVKPELSFELNVEEIGVGEEGTITVTANAAVTADLVVNLTSDNENITLGSKTVIIKTGSASAEASFTGKAEGESVITISCEAATIKTATAKISVVLAYEYPEFQYGTYSAIKSVKFAGVEIKSSATNGEAENKPLGGNDDFGIYAVSDNRTSTVVPISNGDEFTIFYSNFTSTSKDRMNVQLYIDWNGDGKFDGTNEFIKEQEVLANAPAEIKGTITIPSGAVKSSRVRAICYYIPGSAIKNGVGSTESGNLIDFKYSLK